MSHARFEIRTVGESSGVCGVRKSVWSSADHPIAGCTRVPGLRGSAEFHDFAGTVRLLFVTGSAAQREHKRASRFVMLTLCFKITNDLGQRNRLVAGTAQDSAVLLHL